jgi:hypothetical protein
VTLKSYLVDPQNPLLNKDLPSGVNFMPETRKFRFLNQDISSYELRIVCHLTLEGNYVAEQEVCFKVNFVESDEIAVNNDTDALESNSTEDVNDTNADSFNFTLNYDSRHTNKWTNKCTKLTVNKIEDADPLNPSFLINNVQNNIMKHPAIIKVIFDDALKSIMIYNPFLRTISTRKSTVDSG